MGFGGIKITPADSYFSKWIRRRDNYTCQKCGMIHLPNSMGLHNSHFFGRRSLSTRFDPENCDALCFKCHQKFSENPNDYRDWKRRRLGNKKFDALVIRGHLPRADKLDWKLEAKKWREKLKA